MLSVTYVFVSILSMFIFKQNFSFVGHGKVLIHFRQQYYDYAREEGFRGVFKEKGPVSSLWLGPSVA